MSTLSGINTTVVPIWALIVKLQIKNRHYTFEKDLGLAEENKMNGKKLKFTFTL